MFCSPLGRSLVVFSVVALLSGFPGASSASEKPRVVVMTDIAGDPDDQQSLIRFLLYANHFDVEGLIATTSCWKRDEPNVAAIHRVIDSYEAVYPNLTLHADGYPAAEQLHALAKSGIRGYGMASVPDQLNNEAVQHIIAVIDRVDPRPVWFLVWGGGNTLGAAVAKVLAERSAEDAKAFVSKIRGYEIALQDDAFAYIMNRFPDAKLISSALQWKGVSRTLPNIDAWQESRGGNNDAFDPAWVRENVQVDHGALGALYPDPTFLYEGDTPATLYLVPNGLNDPEHMDYGGWGGRFEAERKLNVRSGTGYDNMDGSLDQHRDYALYSDAKDSWTYGETTYNNEYCAIFRWREAFQADFAARMDWCIKPFSAVNHPPIPVVNGDGSLAPIGVTVAPGAVLRLDAAGSSDPDGNELRYHWWVYEECGTYRGPITLDDATTTHTTIQVPKDGAGKTFHVILTLTDNGAPELTRYRRVVVTVEGA